MANGTVHDGDNYTLPPCTFTPPAGKVFDQWEAGENKYNPGDSINNITTNLRMKALWKTNSPTPPNPGNPSTPSTPSNPSSPSTPSTPSKPEPSADFMIPELEEETLEKLEDTEQGKTYSIKGTEIGRAHV